MNFYNKNNFILSSQGYSDVVAPGAGGSDPADASSSRQQAVGSVVATQRVQVVL